MNLIHNGSFLTEKEFHVSIDNRAFAFGDGIFETIIATSGNVSYLADHLKRLSSGIQTLGMEFPVELNSTSTEALIKALIQKNQISHKARVKIIVWRKSGGLFSPTEKTAEYIITASPHQEPPSIKKKAYLYKEVRLLYSPISGYKTLSSLPYVMAGIAKNTLQADDLVLLDTEGHIAECLVSNIFWIKNEKIYTPSLNTGCKEGIMRKQIVQFLNKEKINWEEGKFKEEELLNADFVFTSNVTGLSPIKTIENKNYQPESELFTAIKELVTDQ